MCDKMCDKERELVTVRTEHWQEPIKEKRATLLEQLLREARKTLKEEGGGESPR